MKRVREEGDVRHPVTRIETNEPSLELPLPRR